MSARLEYRDGQWMLAEDCPVSLEDLREIHRNMGGGPGATKDLIYAIKGPQPNFAPHLDRIWRALYHVIYNGPPDMTWFEKDQYKETLEFVGEWRDRSPRGKAL